jgi:hypothetical protein
MTGETPTWRHAFDALEDLTASQFDRVMRTEAFARALSVTVSTAGLARRRLEEVSARWLRVWNIPSRSDIHDLQDLLLALDRRTRDLDRRLESEAAWRSASDDPPR